MPELNQKVYDRAIKLLAIRLHTVGELGQKLKDRRFRDEEVNPVLEKLVEQKFLDDQEFAEIFVEELKRYKDFGFYGIKAKLLARRVPHEIIEQALAEFFTLDDELGVARRLLAKLKHVGRNDWEKLARSLQSRGFRNEAISKILKKTDGADMETQRSPLHFS